MPCRGTLIPDVFVPFTSCSAVCCYFFDFLILIFLTHAMLALTAYIFLCKQSVFKSVKTECFKRYLLIEELTFNTFNILYSFCLFLHLFLISLLLRVTYAWWHHKFHLVLPMKTKFFFLIHARALSLEFLLVLSFFVVLSPWYHQDTTLPFLRRYYVNWT